MGDVTGANYEGTTKDSRTIILAPSQKGLRGAIRVIQTLKDLNPEKVGELLEELSYLRGDLALILENNHEGDEIINEAFISNFKAEKEQLDMLQRIIDGFSALDIDTRPGQEGGKDLFEEFDEFMEMLKTQNPKVEAGQNKPRI